MSIKAVFIELDQAKLIQDNDGSVESTINAIKYFWKKNYLIIGITNYVNNKEVIELCFEDIQSLFNQVPWMSRIYFTLDNRKDSIGVMSMAGGGMIEGSYKTCFAPPLSINDVYLICEKENNIYDVDIDLLHSFYIDGNLSPITKVNQLSCAYLYIWQFQDIFGVL